MWEWKKYSIIKRDFSDKRRNLDYGVIPLEQNVTYWSKDWS